jgi:type VI protein secretion system component VasF
VLQWTPEAVLSLLATLFVGVLVALMANETWALAKGTDPMADQVRALSRRFPPGVFALAVVLGLVLGHLFWT